MRLHHLPQNEKQKGKEEYRIRWGKKQGRRGVSEKRKKRKIIEGSEKASHPCSEALQGRWGFRSKRGPERKGGRISQTKEE